MIKLYTSGVYLLNGNELIREEDAGPELDREAGKQSTIAYKILQAHNTSGDPEHLKIKFDALASHDLTYVNIIQTARASGLERFPLPYVLTCCHNSLCAVGGTINEDDHVFGLTASKKYGGIYLPPHLGVIHQYVRETLAGCGKMILGSDSHTRYGALGTVAIGEGGGELVKQILEQTWDISYPRVVAVYLTGRPNPGIGPHDIAIAIISAVFSKGYVKNAVMEFVGPGIASIPMDYRNSVDVMTTETACLSSVWCTDEQTKDYLTEHGRPEDYRSLAPGSVAYYDGCVFVDLSTVHSMIALPFHPSNGYEIRELNANLDEILHSVEEDARRYTENSGLSLDLRGKIHDHALWAEQGTIAGCAGGTYSNIAEAAHLLDGRNIGNGCFSLSIYPSSQAVMLELMRQGSIEKLITAGCTVRTAFCGPCFGAGDTPAHGALSVRHTTRNFPNREGSKPINGQMACVALMDARSLAATAANGGRITAADELGYDYVCPSYHYDSTVYEHRVYQGCGKSEPSEPLVCGPNIKGWPQLPPLNEHMLLKICAYITDPVTTTDELIPSGETSSFRSNPLRLAEFTLCQRVPEYVGRAKAAAEEESARRSGKCPEHLYALLTRLRTIRGCQEVRDEDITLSSAIYAVKPGDGSAREQAASCQRVLLGGANIANEYATKRYRSNLINWGIIPFLLDGAPAFKENDYIFVPNILKQLEGDMSHIPAYVMGDEIRTITLSVSSLTNEEKEIIRCGCLINYNRKRKAEERGL